MVVRKFFRLETAFAHNYHVKERVFFLSTFALCFYKPTIFLHLHSFSGTSVFCRGLPSQYLYSLVDLVRTKSQQQQRPIIFYDQLGCGRSSQPTNLDAYSISQSVDDLEKLLQHLKIDKFHLYGHSYGGVLAYEYAKRHIIKTQEETNDHKSSLLSIILSNTPTSFALSNTEWERLLKEECGNNDDLFFQRYQCRTETMPASLLDAFQHAGTIWIGTDAVADYIASPPSVIVSNEGEKEVPKQRRNRSPVLLIKGEFDFVTDVCTRGWKDIFSSYGSGSIKELTMKGCAHYCHFEYEKELYGSIVGSFCLEHD
uniref:AB hydrolase-1 domain-containing protein n=1 Tax=Ditylum brightwellii TaxID=49249 RepID=A0A7S1ZT97_9STRA|mmetsp:Transcript_38125/g.57045  ORF Transcript_38125/g.57045 Transcript_38125/m.57045 type:complete len:313 (+) Transcript_38125:603-1541(+)